MRKRDPVLVAFGLSVRRLREAREFTQEKLAEKADLDQTYISGVECGVRNPSIRVIVRIAKGLQTTVAELTKGLN